MAQTKKKQNPVSPKRKKRQISVRVKPKVVNRPTVDDQKILATWQKEVRAMRSKQFSSLDEALMTLIKGVLDKLSLDGKERKDTSEFLEFLFRSNDGLLEDLASCLNIKPE